ncbi:LysR family transcriptional regulator [Inhella gelatinilytica]|uniref:LysR family transcriptional regulator n=1 Tax=Inhella gelatinilytica TaxID=2795030 RepID=A0A931IVN4_9BURK|nr:LysR family transcriptional regulator [Inhella gelatinilytica]MBH9551503.1 LysR family transcriptional regulator [Inhella gelatinilytica]
MNEFSYRHLHYFWVVATEGSMSRAAERLGMAVQTVSAQVKALERDLGHALLKPAGRGLALTEAGQAALRVADQIFQIGDQLPTVVREAGSVPAVRLQIGVVDSLPKWVVQDLLRPVLSTPHLHLIVQVHEEEGLIADLALHKLDAVFSDRIPTAGGVRLHGHEVGRSAVSWYAAPAWQSVAQRFPQALGEVPVLLPTRHAALRRQLDAWFERHGVRPRVVGEFEDSALLKAFGAEGMGVFPAADLVRPALTTHYGVAPVGLCDGVEERFYLVTAHKRVAHPLLAPLVQARTV